MRDTQFHLTSGNEIAITGLPDQVGAEFYVFIGEEAISDYTTDVIMVNGITTIKIKDLFKDRPIIDGQEYIITGQARYQAGSFGELVKVTWVAPKANPGLNSVPANTGGTTPPAVSAASAAQAATSTSTDQENKTLMDEALTEVSQRLNLIDEDLDGTLSEIYDSQNVKKKRFAEIDTMIRRMRAGMRAISDIIAEIEKSKPIECDYFRRWMSRISERITHLEDTCRALRAVANKAQTPAQTPAPAPVQNAVTPPPVTAPIPAPPPATPPVDLGPTNNRIDNLEKDLADLALQLANKASSQDLADLSGSVNNLRAQVTSLEGQMSGLETAIENAGKTSSNGFDRLTAAIDALANRQVPSTASTTSAQSPAAATVQSAVPTTAQTAVNPPSKGKKKSRRESVNFFALVLGIVLGVLALIAMFFYATRSQSIDAERIGASEAKSAAVAEMENARRLQMEMADKMHNLQQEVTGYQRQTFVTPPPPLSSTVTNATVVTNTLAPSSNTNSTVTNIGKLSYHLDRPIEGISLGDTFERQPFMKESWSPGPMGDLYDYRSREFNGYLYLR